MKCPICSQQLLRDSNDCYLCSDGILISGRFLSEAKSTNSRFDIDSKLNEVNKEDSENRILYCPNCSSQMTRMDYLSTGIRIDSCANCHFRWLDDGELDGIRSIKPKLDAEDLLFVSNLEQKQQKERKFFNQRVPYFNLARSLSSVGYIFGDKRTAGPRSILAFGSFGIIKLLFTRIGRILLLIIVIAFGLLVWQAISFITGR